MKLPRATYQGRKRGLLIAFDVGTTYSGASYAKLEPGVSPEIKTVTRFPSKAEAGGDAKVPTVIYYDSTGSAKAIGAATLLDEILDQAEEEGWFKAEWFKLHFRPAGRHASSHGIPALPPNKRHTDVFADFLQYLFDCTKRFITEHDANPAYWDAISGNITFILTHPNGWQLEQQAAYRIAAVKAGLVRDGPQFREYLQFVTEGEASLHYCIHQGLREYAQSDGIQKGIVVVDAGGGTLDISAYRTSSSSQSPHPVFEEMCVPRCHLEGSVMVTLRAKDYISGKLHGSTFENSIDHIVKEFDSKAKHTFSSPDAAALVKFSDFTQGSPAVDVVRGKLRIPGEEMSKFFEASLTCIINTIRNIHTTAPAPIAAVFLVGGFAASGYLYSQLQQFGNVENIYICRPDEHVNKAVASGAASFYLDHYVEHRMARVTYGLKTSIPYNKKDPEHKARRKQNILPRRSGDKITNIFSTLILKGTVVSETKEFRRPYIREAKKKSELFDLKIPLYTYLGTDTDPKWMDLELDQEYKSNYTISADISSYASRLKTERGAYGGLYFVAKFDVILLFGATELKAQVAWIEEGEEKRSPAEIVFN